MADFDDDSVRSRVIRKAAELAGIDPREFDLANTLESLGLDSSDAVILAMEIEEATGVEIDVGIFLRFETIADAALEIARIVGDKPSAGPG